MTYAWTVVERMRHLGYQPEKKTTWKLGTRMEKWYRARYNELPPKELREKTSGKGSHCFAIYQRFEDIEQLDRFIETFSENSNALAVLFQ